MAFGIHFKRPTTSTPPKAATPKSTPPSKAPKKPAAKKPAAKKPAAASGNSLIDPFAPLTNADLTAQINAGIKQKYGGAENTLTGLVGQSEQQQGKIGDWFSQYQAQLANLDAQRNAGQQQAQQYLQNVTAAQQQNAAAANQQVNAAAAADAASRGATVNPALANTQNQAVASRQGALGNYLAQLSSTGLNQANYGLNRQANAGREGVQAHLDETARKAKILDALKTLNEEKGSFATTYGAELKQKNFENQLATQVASGKQASSEASITQRANAATQRHNDAAQARADRLAAAATKDQEKANTPNKYGVLPAQWASWSTSHRQRVIDAAGKSDKKTTKTLPGGVKPLEPASQNVARDKIKSAVYWGKYLKEHNPDWTAADIAAALTTGREASTINPTDPKTGKRLLDKDKKPLKVHLPAIPKFPRDYIGVATDLAMGTSLTDATVRNLHKRGVRVNALGYPIGSELDKKSPGVVTHGN